ncbi:M23 family metallopeptidase [Flavobacteriales bacterium]|nr:M23 family metallopeptidase [Flavobacteriales bacterium]|tara:strand:- start:524 stop:1336 length:813 start_codon:yes stop_codon:yes gene_type:complete
MKNYLLLTFILITSLCKAEHKVKIYYEQIENGYNIYADNDEFCPVSVKVDFNVTNLNINGGNNNVYVVNAKGKKQLLTSLKVSKNGKAYKFSFKYWTNYGKHNNKEYDNDYIYDLPFKTSNQFKIYQGYNGTFSHQNENSLDFTMPVGTELTAVREGVVIKVIEKNKKNCGKEECKKYNNLIIIYHPDGTFAEYAHVKHNGSKVKVGDKISKGQLIGYSGNVGWSTGPHLHLVVFNQNLENRETLKTKFKTGDGNTSEYLSEKKVYSRNY